MVPKFLKVSNWFPLLLKRLTFVLSVKSRFTPLEGVPRVSSSIYWIFLLLFFWIFFYFFLFLNFLKKIKKLSRVKLSSCLEMANKRVPVGIVRTRPRFDGESSHWLGMGNPRLFQLGMGMVMGMYISSP